MEISANSFGRLPSVQTESDTSDHSYHVQVRPASLELQRVKGGSPFAAAQPTMPPIDRGPSSRPSPPAPLWNRGGSASRSVSNQVPRRDLRVSFDMPVERPSGDLRVDGTVVRKRRRIPVWLAVAFGLVTCTSLIIAICMVPLTVYNYRRIKSQRAARTVADLGEIIVPLIEAIYNKTVGPAPASIFDRRKHL